MAELIQKRKDVIILAAVATLALLFYIFDVRLFRETQAAQVSSRSATLSTSTPGELTNITLKFTIQNSFTNSSTLTIDFPDNWISSSSPEFEVTDASDYDISTSSPIAGGGQFTINASSTCTGAAGNTRFEISNIASTTQVFTFTHCNGTSLPLVGDTFHIEIGTHATTSATGNSRFRLPVKEAAVGTADIDTISVGGTFGGTGDMLVALVEAVTVSVTVAETLTFNIRATSNGACDGSFSTLGGPETTSTTVPFGSISTSETFFHACHDLVVSTNAGSGFTVSGHESDVLTATSSGLTIPDTTCDGGSCTQLAQDDWTDAANNGFGHSCANIGQGAPCSTVYTAAGGACGAAPCYRQFATSTEDYQSILTGSSATSTAVGRVEYKLSVDGTQAAGSYENQVIYVATPTF